MSALRPLRRPRVLDLKGRSPGVTFAARRDVAWPCHAYRVTLPVRTPGRLNLFEETVLHLLELGRPDVEQLASVTCLPLDLTEFILLRLQDRSLIATTLELTEIGRAYLDVQRNAPKEYEGRIVFRELVGGRLLPVLWPTDLQCETVTKWDEFGMWIERGPTGDAQETYLYAPRPACATTAAPPTAVEVLAVLRQHRRLHRQFALVHKDYVASVGVQAGQVEVLPEPESYFLRCELLVPPGGSEVVVSDPFGYGCSEILEQAYLRRALEDPDEQEHVFRLKEQALSRRAGGAAQSNEPSSGPAPISREYPELRRLNRELEEGLPKCRCLPQSRDEEAQLAQDRQRLVRDLYSAIEWALRYCLDEMRDDPQIQLLTLGSAESNEALLLQFGRSIGFETERLGHLLKVSPGRIKSFYHGAAEMRILAAVGLTSAFRNPLHPIRALAEAMPDWLCFIAELRKVRDPVSHGDFMQIPSENFETFHVRTQRTIRIILPRLTGELIGAVPDRPTALRSEYESRLAARIHVERILGMRTFRLLKSHIAQLLVGVESGAERWPIEGEIEAAGIVNDWCSTLQSVLQQVIADFPNADDGLAENRIARATARAGEAGFSLEGGALPRALTTVRSDATLGACTMALLLRAPASWLAAVAIRQPGFLLHLTRMVDLRRHGNCSVPLAVESLRELKKQTYETIKTTAET